MTVTTAQATAKPHTVYFFGTCLVDIFYPEAGLHGIQLLEREGVQVEYPQAQSCCGQPAYNSGFDDEARAVAREQLTLFSQDWPIIVPSGSCAGMLKHHWPALFAGQPEQRQAEAVAGRVYELFEFLVDVLAIQLTDKGVQETITLHTSCSARREMGVAEHHVQLLQQLDQVVLKVQPRVTECCGFGGTFAVKQGAISSAMVNDKCDAISSTGCQRMACGDSGCLMNISGALAKRQSTIEPVHLATYLWERTQ